MKERIMNGNSSFSLIISILTLAIMTVGSTFAFFTTTVKKNQAVNVGAANFRLSVNIEALYNSKHIIPTNNDDIAKAVNNKCVDIRGYGACYAYLVNIENLGEDQELYAKLRFNNDIETELANLKYLTIDYGYGEVNKEDINLNLDYETIKNNINSATSSIKVLNVGNEENIISLKSGEKKNIIVIVWLSNYNIPQDEESGKEFTGYVTVDSTLGQKITGSITATVNNSNDNT